MTQKIVELVNFIERLAYIDLKFSTKSFFQTTVQKLWQGQIFPDPNDSQ